MEGLWNTAESSMLGLAAILIEALDTLEFLSSPTGSSAVTGSVGRLRLALRDFGEDGRSGMSPEGLSMASWR